MLVFMIFDVFNSPPFFDTIMTGRFTKT